MSANSRLKATKIIGQRKGFYRLRIPESSCARKEIVDIDILVTSRNSDRKIMQSIRITSQPSLRKRKWDQLSQFWRTSAKIIPHFHNEPRVQENQQVKGQQSCIFICLFIVKSMGTETTTWSEFPNWGKAIVEQITVSEEINKSKRASLWESGIQAGKLTIWVRRSFEIAKL